ARSPGLRPARSGTLAAARLLLFRRCPGALQNQRHATAALRRRDRPCPADRRPLVVDCPLEAPDLRYLEPQGGFDETDRGYKIAHRVLDVERRLEPALLVLRDVQHQGELFGTDFQRSLPVAF